VTVEGSLRFFSRASASACVAASSSPYLTSRRHLRPASYSEIQQALSTLKVDVSVKDAALKKAYLDLVRQNHPDKGGSEAMMKEITTSYNLLKGLSESDRKSFTTSHNYGPGATSSTAAGGFTRQRQPQYGSNPHDAHDAYRRKYEQQSRGYYRYDPQSGTYQNQYAGHANPFQHGPFPNVARDLRALPLPMLFFRALCVYSAFCVVILMTYRMYKDYTHDDGWAASQAAFRNERIESLQRMRQEARDRAMEREKENLERRRADTMSTREQRALDYARRREHEMTSADHGAFPRLNPEGLEGLVMRDYNDPVGIAYYVPPLPNGAPPFSGNGRFQYSTGSIARSQCVPTIREGRQRAPLKLPSTPTLKPTLSSGEGVHLGHLAPDNFNGRQQTGESPRRVDIGDANIHMNNKDGGAVLETEALMSPAIVPGGDATTEPPRPKGGFYGSKVQVESDQPLNMRRRHYERPPVGIRAEVVDPPTYDPSAPVKPYSPDGLIARRPMGTPA
jgi:curved DNA-binding protein CbpA